MGYNKVNRSFRYFATRLTFHIVSNCELKFSGIKFQYFFFLPITTYKTDGDEIMAIVMQKSKDEYERGQQRVPSEASQPSHSVAKPNSSEIETAKRLMHDSERIEKSLQFEIEQQAYFNRKMVKHEMKSPGLETTGHSGGSSKRPESAKKSKPSF